MLKNINKYLLLLILILIFSFCKEKTSATKQVKITWLGHAAFLIEYPEENTSILIDPFIKNNPVTPEDWKDLSKYKVDAILVSHSHFDHSADVVEIAKLSNASVIGVFDFISQMNLPDNLKKGGNVGGTFKIKNIKIYIVPAMHSSEGGGRPIGFILQADGYRTIYHTGDTWIFSDMSLIHEIFKPEIILLNVGGGPFTQPPEVAKLSVKKYFKPEYIIPMHYNTFGIIAKEEEVKKVFTEPNVHFLKPGESQLF
ncbi:MAG: metal-dependent hydrolase [Leptospiraceae bacterium]|nr:MAG: metal-dependent hydrolase [Leptospiraceae bacterium]